MPPIPPEELVPKFEAELAKVGGLIHRASTPQELEEVLRAILASAQASAVVLSRNPMLAELGLAERIRAWELSVAVCPAATSEASSSNDLREFAVPSFSATVGITGVDFVLAESGTLVLSSVTEGSQLASLAPPVHVAFYRPSQVLGTLEELLERLPVPCDPNAPLPGRSVVFITGPSRTADIEQILIRGVHGPRHVHAVLVEDSCLAK